MARLLADEQFPVRIQDRLRRLGHDIVSVRSFDTSPSGDGKSDEEVLQIAASENRTVLTLNTKDFKRLHEDNAVPNHKGIIGYVLGDDDPDFQGRFIDERIKRETKPPRRLDRRFVLITQGSRRGRRN